ncbi:hypothetical protein IP65_20430 [Novosphingobium sp. AAP1]|uniref:hypothetical protein n=1 Tax=Novosphingobium sp. AAP1 TaxID=1523413 RepID=UPI0006B977DA|nr:hypothetical protein [Novosphingobium sp. AAP1]KPF49104.1 hypothetical protein IP65_20430 [Novosphingobium sp. AAP1]
MEQALVASLEAVAEVMENAQDPWWIIASAAVALHGADPGPVGDVDVLLSLRDARRIIPTLGLALHQGSHHAEFRSTIFATWREPPLPVEFMAGFHHCQGGRWRAIVPATRQRIALGGKTLFVPDLAELGNILQSFGRPKDLARAARLAALSA